MKIPVCVTRLFTLLFVALLAYAPAAMAQNATHVVISQAYGGGGNAGATYNQDFVELYNPTSAPISLVGLSIQYGSTTGVFGSSAANIKALTGTILAGKYYLVGGASGTNGAPLPIPDETGSFNLATAAGKVALVNGTASQGTSTPCIASNIVDEVSFGTGDSCAEGTAAPAPSVTASVSRKSPGVDSDNNSVDFAAGPITPHNASSLGGGGSTALAIASASANPASVSTGSSTVLSVTVTPGATSTSFTVTGDLSNLGGSATQAFAASSTANVYTYTLNVSGSVAAKAYSIPVTAKDQTNASASGAISLTVTTPATVTPISTIQANRPTYVGTNITFNGVVTLVTSTGYYVQTISSTPGSTGDEGILVFSGSGKNPAGAAVGNNVSVTGLLTLYPLPAASHTPSLEVTGASLTVNGTAALPTPIALPTPTASGDIYQLTPYESMRVSIPAVTSTSPTDANLTENTETYTSTGQFYAVVGSTARPFREPGIDFRDFPTSTCPTVTNCTAQTTTAGAARPSAVTLFDDNPERIIIESSLGGGTAIDVTSNTTLTGITGVVDFSYATDVPYGDPARIILDPAVVPVVSGGMTVTPLPIPGAGVFTVAAFNIERFFDTNSANDLYYDPVANTTKKSLAVDVTPAAYARRLQKVSLAVRTILNNPDIISFEETENVGVLKDIAAQIDTDTTTGTAPHYVAYGTDSVNTFTDDIGGISVGFLVKSTVAVTSFQQMGNTSTFTASSGQQTLNDRPSDVLKATISRGDGVKPYPITVISNHLRSLSGIGTSADTRLKKELQAEMLANLIQTSQAAGEHVVAVGDLNAFQFSDGYTDTLGTITGNVGTNIAVQPGKGGILTTPAIDLITTLPANQQQTYVEFGNAQVLDHQVITADLASSTTLQVAHLNSDFPVDLGNVVTAARVSDHDVPVSYITLPAPKLSASLAYNGNFPATPVGTSSAGQVQTLTNTGETAITFTSITATGDFSQSNNCGTSLAINASCAINVVFTPTTTGTRTGTLTFQANAFISPVSLSGTGGTGSTTATLTASSTSFAPSTPGVFTVHVSCNSACGSVDYREDGMEWATVPLDSNGNFVSSGLPPYTSVGQHTMTINYLGNAQYSASTSNTVTFTILAAGSGATTTTLTASSTSFTAASPAAFAAHVSCNAACGIVDLKEDGVEWARVPLDSNGNFVSSGMPPNSSIGTHTLTISYLGNAQYAASTSNMVTFSIVATGSTATTTIASISSMSFSASQPATISVHVSCNTACGSANFTEDGLEWGMVPLDSNGNYNYAGTNGMPNRSIGQHTVTINYLGNAQYGASTSNTLTLTINP